MPDPTAPPGGPATARRAVLILAGLAALSACAQVLPPGLMSPAALGPADTARRGATELAVKGDLAAVLADIDAGGGPALTRAFDAARVPPADRPARALQLDGDLGLYTANPGALVSALLLWGQP